MRLVADRRLMQRIYRALDAEARRLLAAASPELLSRLRYHEAWGKWPDFEHPATFDEKLLWLNLYWRHPLKSVCGDKYTMRQYVEHHGLGHLLTRLYAIYDSVEEIDFSALPSQFVIKCTHACKSNVFCRDKARLDMALTRRLLRRWMRMNFGSFVGELHYAAMKPRIICEELLDDGTGALPIDYKIYCFSGRPYCLICCTDRVENGRSVTTFRDLQWNLLPFYKDRPARLDVPAPSTLPEMLAACPPLSAPFPFVRMDFYSIRGRAVLGEMTFTPSACVCRDFTVYAQQYLGELLELPDAYPARPSS